jgi:hypothetical protein
VNISFHDYVHDGHVEWPGVAREGGKPCDACPGLKLARKK